MTALALIVVLVCAGCAGGGDASAGDDDSTTARAGSPPPDPTGRFAGGTKIDSCASEFAGSPPKGPDCMVVNEVLPLEHCRNPPAAGDVRVRGISCRHAYGLLVPLASPGLGFRPHETLLYQPWKATGAIQSPKPVSPSGWTCWAGGPGDPGPDRVCWRGADVLLYQFTP